jgi:hypothetical protein
MTCCSHSPARAWRRIFSPATNRATLATLATTSHDNDRLEDGGRFSPMRPMVGRQHSSSRQRLKEGSVTGKSSHKKGLVAVASRPWKSVKRRFTRPDMATSAAAAATTLIEDNPSTSHDRSDQTTIECRLSERAKQHGSRVRFHSRHQSALE